MPVKQPLAERFWTKVLVRGPNDCWFWQAAMDKPDGYGMIGGDNGKTIRSHRAAYLLTHGEIPEGMQVLHKCDNKQCCNPAHLYAGTHQDNMNDLVERPQRSYSGPPSGERNPSYNKTLSREDRRLISMSDEPTRALARRYGVSRYLILTLKRGIGIHVVPKQLPKRSNGDDS